MTRVYLSDKKTCPIFVRGFLTNMALCISSVCSSVLVCFDIAVCDWWASLLKASCRIAKVIRVTTWQIRKADSGWWFYHLKWFDVCVCVCVYKAISIRRHGSEWGWCLPKPWRAGRVSMQQAHLFPLYYYTSPQAQAKCLNGPLN